MGCPVVKGAVTRPGEAWSHTHTHTHTNAQRQGRWMMSHTNTHTGSHTFIKRDHTLVLSQWRADTHILTCNAALKDTQKELG